MPAPAQRELFSANFVRAMTPAGVYEVQSEARGAHWVAWITRGGSAKPERSVIVVGATQAEAEAAARQWADSQP
jgi:hypothetical protein